MHQYQKWRAALQLAPSAFTVRAIVRDYVGSLGDLAASVPADCRAALATADLDISSAAVTLLQAELRARGSEEECRLLHEIAHMLASAAVRMAELKASADIAPSRGAAQQSGARSAQYGD